MRDAEAWGSASGAQSLRRSWAGSASGAVSSARAPFLQPARMAAISHWSTMRSVAGSEVSTARGTLWLVDERVIPGVPPPPGIPPIPGVPPPPSIPPASTCKGVERD